MTIRVLLILCFLWNPGCHSRGPASAAHISHPNESLSREFPIPGEVKNYFHVRHEVRVKRYFSFMDSVVAAMNAKLGYKISEHVLVHANPWILDSLKATDYYSRRSKGIFQEDQATEIILHKGDSLLIPDSLTVMITNRRLNSTILDLNIPEFRIRLIQGEDTILSCKVRVGRNAIQYLQVVDRDVNLRTPIGEGKIVRIARIPYQLNPETGKLYEGTHRDDGGYTKMPIIPWLEPEINGVRYGTMIHPTTNPVTLGKAFSHGCVGTSEQDAWMIYYNCPVGTRVRFRYDLKIVNENGDTVILKDIYRQPPKHID